MSSLIDNEDSDDSFDNLMHHLPIYQPRSPKTNKTIFSEKQNDTFQNWLINRFNRVGPIPFFELISRSFLQILNHLKITSITYLFFLIIYWFTGYYLKIIILTLFHLFSFGVMASIHSTQKYFSNLPLIFSISGIFCFFSLLIGSILQNNVVSLFLKRSSSTTFWDFIYTSYEISLFFIPCLTFDSKVIDTWKLLKFTWKILWQSNVFPYSLLIFLSGILFEFIGPFTFGISFWLSINMRVMFFEAVCGSSTNCGYK